MRRLPYAIGLFAVFTLAWVTQAHATFPYFNPGPFVTPLPGPGLPSPSVVPGKEYSNFIDRNAAVMADPEQVLAWDGNPANPAGGAGATDGFDFSGSRLGDSVDRQVDALAHSGDALFFSVLHESSHLVFSVSTLTPAPPVISGHVATSGGKVIGGSSDISFEMAGSGAMGIWALGPVDIDGMSPPRDVDGLELWGPEFPFVDSIRYSHMSDAATGVSVWSYDPFLHISTPFLSHAMMVTAVESLLGPLPDTISRDLLDLDALMVFESNFNDVFDDADVILFSIAQLADPLDADGFYATGAELMTLTSSPMGGAVAAFLFHGGHLWDHAFALASMIDLATGIPLDINALEAVSVPEPATIVLLAAGVGLVALRRRHRPLDAR